MLPPAGSEARWREEVMPGRTSGEVMLALTHQEAKKRPKEASGDVLPPSSDCTEQHRRTQGCLRQGQFRLRRAKETMSALENHADRHRSSVVRKRQVQQVMPGETSGEVMYRKASAKVMLFDAYSFKQHIHPKEFDRTRQC